MPRIVEDIAQFLLWRLSQSGTGSIEVQRSELAARFSCAPSQINYCLATRFALERGYLVESRRGGGGYIRITEIAAHGRELWERALEKCRLPLSQTTAEHLVELVCRVGLVTHREARLLLAAVDRQTLELSALGRDEMRARLLRAMLGTLMINER
ncbi:MAG: Transcriptional regulator CtsR [Firmicutes bacterium]|nr:Transcriptional regulator CtsR [Bacillota bacterium]